MSEYFSQHGEDKWIHENIALPEHGTFVEVGADNGIENSNTLHFERSGWDGLCIEANPLVIADLCRNRKCKVAPFGIGIGGVTDAFIISEKKGWSGFNRKGTFGTPLSLTEYDLTRVCRLFGFRPRNVDLLSIDTEGNELEIIQTMDFQSEAAWRPTVIIIEHWTAPAASVEPIIREYFKSLPYECVHRTECNLVFKRKQT